MLPTIRASINPPYRLLLEAVGLPVPAGTSPFNRPYSHSPQYQQQQGYYSPSPQQYRGGQHSPGFGNGNGQNLSPLLMPQNMPMRGGLMGSPGLGPRTPQGRSRGRLSPGPGPGSMMMSPGSDPFNPVRGFLIIQYEYIADSTCSSTCLTTTSPLYTIFIDKKNKTVCISLDRRTILPEPQQPSTRSCSDEIIVHPLTAAHDQLQPAAECRWIRSRRWTRRWEWVLPGTRAVPGPRSRPTEYGQSLLA